MSSLPPHIALLHARRAQRPALVAETSGDIIETLAALRAERTVCALCTVVATSGSVPRRVGAKMIVADDGRIISTIGGGRVELEVIESAREVMRAGRAQVVRHHLTRDLGMCCGGTMEVFIEPQTYRDRLVLFGAGHVAKAVYDIAVQADFDVIVVDDRIEWSNLERFPSAEVRCAPPELVFDELRSAEVFGPQTYVLILTHDHGLDQRVLERFLRGTETAYLGVIGSVRKREKFKQRLRGAGFDAEAIERFQSPMGIDIGAVTPAEIAISILAELVKIRRSVAQTRTRAEVEHG